MVLAVLEHCSFLIVVSSVSATILPVSVGGGGKDIYQSREYRAGRLLEVANSKRDNGS